MVNIVVEFKSGSYAGKQAVIKDISSIHDDGQVSVQLRNSNGLSTGGIFKTPWTDLGLVVPVKKNKVIVLVGQSKGKRGVVKVCIPSL